MKLFFTLFLITGFLGNVYAQREQTPKSPESPRQDSPSDMAKDWPRPNIPVNIGTVLFPTGGNTTTTNRTPQTPQSYETIIAEADACYNRHQYDLAASRYNDALAQRNEAYPKDQLIRIEAERAKAQKEQAITQQEQAEQARLDALHKIHFTGLVMSDDYKNMHRSRINVEDSYSSFLKPGKYTDLQQALYNAGRGTLDGIAIPAGTRLIVYQNNDCTGNVLLDITGPAIVNNVKWQNDSRYMDANTKDYTPDLQTTYPQTVRTWSETDMHGWINGSLEIIAL
jgi:hypothetical protein